MSAFLSRRALLAGAGAASAALATGVGEARIAPSSLNPLIGPGYRPTDRAIGQIDQSSRSDSRGGSFSASRGRWSVGARP